MSLKKILQPFKEEMRHYEENLERILKSDIPIVDRVSKYIIKHKGKSLRPFLVILSAKLCGRVNADTYNIAATVELLHTASLIHDDVVDESELRRGFPSINAIWKNKVSVLMGDYLLSKSLITATETGKLEVMNMLSNAAKQLSKGELLQIQNVWRQKNTEEEYYTIIENKTAALISACCDLGALSISENGKSRSSLKSFGENLGMAFQIKDDLLDYQSSSAIIGKPSGNDIKEKKYTLPLIHAISIAPKKEEKKIRRWMSKGPTNKQIEEIIQFAIDYDGISYAQAKMHEYHAMAIKNLEHFPNDQTKETAIKILDFVISRDK